MQAVAMRPKLLVIWLAAVTAVLGFVIAHSAEVARGAPAAAGKMTLDELDVHRLNVIEPDGKPRLILSSRARLPGAWARGVEYPHPGRNIGGGLVFFNDDGTEAGGLAYRTVQRGGVTDNSAIFTMDQYEQNELLSLTYGRDHGQRVAGLTVLDDHPDKSIVPLLQTYAELTHAPAGEAHQQLQQRFDQQVKDSIDVERTRVFVGKRGDDAQLVLGDKQGKPRIVLKVDGQGEPTIELLDATGAVKKRITAL
jgi:hypothetical protein